MEFGPSHTVLWGLRIDGDGVVRNRMENKILDQTHRVDVSFASNEVLLR